LESVLFFWAGLGWRRFWLRTLPLWIGAPLAGLTILLYGQVSGNTYFHWLFLNISDGSISLAVATTLRVLAIGLPGVVLFMTVDPTDLADGLAQVLRLPARFVLGGLAALRLVGLFLDDWRSLELARRARGVADRGRLRRFASQAFALFVLSIRRATKLATAMEARGFGAPIERTWARESPFGWREWLLVLAGAGIAALALTVTVVTGHWHFIVG
jgi:energy-coupling factor transport system permease protein